VALVVDVWSAADHGHKSKAFDVLIKRLVPEAIAALRRVAREDTREERLEAEALLRERGLLEDELK
jgi:hypothetical protein